MTKYVCTLICAFFIAYAANAAVGDTTIVQAHDTTWLSYYNNYDTTVKFPDGSKSYRKIYMTFTMGKYHCPGSPTWCGDWDYTVLTYLMTKTGDTVELARLISPYANASNPRTTWSWKQHYVFDVTDYYPLLKDTGTVRILYSGYSGGFTANIKFTFIEGTPDRNVVGIKRLWHGSPGYGGTTSIDSSFTNRNLTAPTGTESAALKFLVTGHGSDANGCCEFASHYYNVMLNSTNVDTKQIWRSDCGANELYPQTGTWIYERANWCPGALVYWNTHNLPGIVSGTNFSLALHFEPYTVASPSGVYTSEAQVFYYGPLNKTLDASIDDIIAPTDYEGHFRENALCGNPRIHIKNTGSTTITSVKIKYGVTTASYLPEYTWTGTLPSLHDTDIVLPEPWELRVKSGTTGPYTFSAQILEVNGTTDNDASNDVMTTTFTPAVSWPTNLVFTLSTNKSVAGGVSETSWKLYELSNLNTPIAQRVNNNISTIYKDTLTLAPSCYKLVVEDAGCDGVSWWNYVNYPTNPGTGSFKVSNVGSAIAKTLTGYYNGDFGCGFTQYFTTAWPNLEVNTVTQEGLSIDAYPNPAQKQTRVTITGIADINGTLQVIDGVGKTVMVQQMNTAEKLLDLGNLQNGMYTLLFTDNKNERLQTRIIIAK